MTTQQIWFTSDIHAFHKKHPKTVVLNGKRYVEQKMKTMSKHGIKWMIEKWNSTISKKDMVYILGDFAFGSHEGVRKTFG